MNHPVRTYRILAALLFVLAAIDVFHENLPQSEEDHLPGTWHWPEGVL